MTSSPCFAPRGFATALCAASLFAAAALAQPGQPAMNFAEMRLFRERLQVFWRAEKPAVVVQTGQAVKEGDHLVTLEAMKMNIYIYAPKTGKVAAVLVNPGDAVKEGSVILRIA